MTYKLTTKSGETDLVRKEKLERVSNLFVGAMMCIGGAIMLGLAFTSGSTDKGNVLPGFAIAVLGVIANTIFWRKYARLNKAEPNPILAVQARLYRAKSLVDGCVTLVLLSVLIAPQSLFSYYFDLVGSVVVAAYLLFCGMQTIRERWKR